MGLFQKVGLPHSHRHDLTSPGSIRGVQWFTGVIYFTGVILFEASSVLPSRQTGVRGQQKNTVLVCVVRSIVVFVNVESILPSLAQSHVPA